MQGTQKSLYGFEMREPDLRRTDGERSHDIKQLWQRSHEILALVLQGHSHRTIAETLSISEGTVSNTVNCTLGRQKLSEMRQKRDDKYIDVSKEVSRLSEKAIKVYEEIFDSETISYSLKKATADTVTMDLGGHRAPTKIDTKSLHMVASVSEIEEFKKRGIAAAREAGMLVTVEKAIEKTEDKEGDAKNEST